MQILLRGPVSPVDWFPRIHVDEGQMEDREEGFRSRFDFLREEKIKCLTMINFRFGKDKNVWNI